MADDANGTKLPGPADALFQSAPPELPDKQSDPPPEPSFENDYFNWLDSQVWDFRYRDGWFEAGELLARDLAQHNATWSMIDTPEPLSTTLPMLYCYRHFLEISLKQLVLVLAKLSGLPACAKMTHRLSVLWTEVQRHKPRSCGADLPGSEETDEHVERLIAEFDGFDPTSETFRYRRDTRGHLHEERVPAADMKQLMDVMGKLRRYFDEALKRADHQVWLKTDPQPD